MAHRQTRLHLYHDGLVGEMLPSHCLRSVSGWLAYSMSSSSIRELTAILTMRTPFVLVFVQRKYSPLTENRRPMRQRATTKFQRGCQAKKFSCSSRFSRLTKSSTVHASHKNAAITGDFFSLAKYRRCSGSAGAFIGGFRWRQLCGGHSGPFGTGSASSRFAVW